MVGMCRLKPGTGLLVIVSAFLAAGCGELDSMLSTTSVYRVNAVVEGRNLDECAIMGIDSRIRPFFLNSVAGDPDVTGLVVFLETPEGEQASRRVRYIIGSEDQVSGQIVDIDNDTGSRIPEDTAPESPQVPAGQAESGGSGYEYGSNSGYGENEDDGTLPPDEKPLQEAGISGGEESVGTGEDLLLGGDSGDAPAYQIREKRSFSDPSGETGDSGELVVYVPRLDGELPPLLFPENLAIGPYIMVFQVLGLQGVLGYSEKLIYYISDADLALGDIQTYHSGNEERSGVVNPGSVIMLETKVSADDRLEPYVIWYNGKRPVREGPVSKGVDRLLWQAPGQTGFQSIRAEIFPFEPPATFKNTNGLIKELSLVISSKQAKRAVGNTGVFQQDGINRWYQLGGDLSDSLAPGNAGRELAPVNSEAITWLPKAGIYGLGAGSAYSYTISGNLFTPDKNLPGRGQFVFRFTLQSSGIISSVLFNLDQTSQTLKLDFSGNTQTNQLILNYALGDEKREQKLTLPFSGQDEWISAVIDFSAGGNEFLADIGLLSAVNGEFTAELASLADKSAPEGKGIALPGPLTGEGVLRIGGPALTANSSLGGASGPGTTAGLFSALNSGITGGAEPAPFTAGQENTGTAVPANTANTAALRPALLSANAGNTNTGTADDAGVSEPSLIMDAIVMLFNADSAGEKAAAEELEAETGEAEGIPEEGVPPGDASPEQTQAAAVTEIGAPVSSGQEQSPQPALPAIAEPETNGEKPGNITPEKTGLALSGEEPEPAQTTGNDGHTPDARDTEALALDSPAPELY
jgi:hypothetical protein